MKGEIAYTKQEKYTVLRFEIDLFTLRTVERLTHKRNSQLNVNEQDNWLLLFCLIIVFI